MPSPEYSKNGDRGDGRGGSFNGISHIRVCGGRLGRGRRVQVQGGRVGGRGALENGIDISDVTCYFEDPDWASLSNDTRKIIT